MGADLLGPMGIEPVALELGSSELRILLYREPVGQDLVRVRVRVRARARARVGAGVRVRVGVGVGAGVRLRLRIREHPRQEVVWRT